MKMEQGHGHMVTVVLSKNNLLSSSMGVGKRTQNTTDVCENECHCPLFEFE